MVPPIAVAAMTNDERAEMNFFMTTYSFLVFFPGRRSPRFKHICFLVFFVVRSGVSLRHLPAV
jgi:hypothetical protein